MFQSTKNICTAIALFMAMTLSAQLNKSDQSTNQTRLVTNFNQGWRFLLGSPDAPNYQMDLDDSKWEQVTVPHSLELTSMDLNGFQDDKYQKTFLRNVGWYRKHFEVPNRPTQKIFLEFEGVHQVTDVWVNDKHVGQHAVGGYTPFHFDISEHVNYGESNLVTVLADNRRRDDIPPDPGPMDYIKFGGLYRDVYLVETNPVHITFNWESASSGINITTPTVDPLNMNATIDIKTAVKNETNSLQKVHVINRIVDHKGVVVLKLKQEKNISPGQEITFDQIGSIEDNLRLWSPVDPYLYRVNTQVEVDGKVMDEVENRTGFRKIEINHKQGVVLNGKPIKLIGTNRHQHYGFIGDAMPDALHYKDVLQLKKLGMNVLRTAHYPHDNAILEACDELGLLVYEEAPTWMSIGNEAWFDNFEKATRAMVRNHRNHTSVFIWGAGINHRGYVPRAHNVIKQEDPFRFTASQGSRWTGWQTSGLTDIYAQMVYGPYYWSGDEPVLAMEGRRGPSAVNDYLGNSMKLGLISWTAHAYYTFHDSNNPKDRSRGGFTTVFRYPRPEEALDWYPAELTKYPYTKISSYFTTDSREVTVYSNAQSVQLLLNGKEISTQSPDKRDEYKYLKHAPFHFKIPLGSEGTLTANGLDDGKKVSSDAVRSPLDPYQVVLEFDLEGRSFVADGSDIVVGHAKVVDRNGTVIQDASKEVEFSISGPGTLVGDGKGIGSNPMPTQYGVAPVLVRAGFSPGTIKVSAKAKGLKSGTMVLQTQQSNLNVTQSKAKPIYDFEKIKVDIGEKEQLVQFDWIPWNGDDKQKSVKEFSQLGGFKASIQSVGDVASTRWLGEINVMGKYGFAHGEGVLGMSKEGLELQFSNLKKGSYKLVTYHHAPRTNTDHMDPNQEKMSTYQIYQIPYSTDISVEVNDKNGSKMIKGVEVTEGKDMQTSEFGSAEIHFESDGENPISIKFKGSDQKGVWLNSFELSEWF